MIAGAKNSRKRNVVPMMVKNKIDSLTAITLGSWGGSPVQELSSGTSFFPAELMSSPWRCGSSGVFSFMLPVDLCSQTIKLANDRQKEDFVWIYVAVMRIVRSLFSKVLPARYEDLMLASGTGAFWRIGCVDAPRDCVCTS